MKTKCKTCRIFAAVALILMISISVADKYLVIPAGASTRCDGPDEVVSGGGRCWKDRNLGATSVARFEDDDLAYGDLYQWGRLGDGHQNRNSPFTTINSVNDVPGHSNFIKHGPVFPYDWRNPSKDILWQGLSSINNPCPQGFRIPTEVEWDVEIASWDSPDIIGAWKSPLKLVFAGIRKANDGAIENAGVRGNYWSSTVFASFSRFMRVSSNDAVTDASLPRAHGLSVRCIKD
jgi:hypothetical protein